ncbi:hypothetical protein WJX75_001572 [Coccomyxa subellipsoidea]|uniref:Uncharacterized protein n=1 Tax=Coccomyxa subellipsoidea TaxID=248742 RepID=A0ABR2YFR2_9CHLO
MNTSSAYATLLLICLAAALCASPTWATSRHPGAARTLLDGVTLQKFDSLVSLTRPDGITLPSLYNSLRNTFNGYFTEEPAVNSPAESPAGTVQEGRVLAEEAGDDLEIFMLSSPDGSRRLHQAKATAVQKTAVPAPPAQQAAAAQFLASRTSAPVLVDMTGSQLEKTLLAPPNANGQRAKIEGPVDTGNAPVFDGSGKLVSGGRRLSQSEAGRLSTGQRVSLQPAPQQVNTPAIVPGRVSIDSAGRAAGSSSAATFDAFGRPLSQTLAASSSLEAARLPQALQD